MTQPVNPTDLAVASAEFSKKAKWGFGIASLVAGVVFLTAFSIDQLQGMQGIESSIPHGFQLISGTAFGVSTVATLTSSRAERLARRTLEALETE